jgi:Exostosin family
MQVERSCQDDGACFHYNLRDRGSALSRLRRRGGIAAAAADLGYASQDEYLDDVDHFVEAVYMASTFCLMPTGDTPKRRGFVEAILSLCIPVVFSARSREYPWYLSDAALAAGTVLFDVGRLRANRSALHAHLQALLPRAPEMRAALARAATSLQYAYSDLGAEDHAAVGPDAWDIALYRMAQLRSNVSSA